MAWKDGLTLGRCRPRPSSRLAGTTGDLKYRLFERGCRFETSDCCAVRAITQGAQPSMLTTFNEYKYNLGRIRWACSTGFRTDLEFDWDDPNSASLPGVVVAESAQQAMRMIRDRSQGAGAEEAARGGRKRQRTGWRNCQGPAIARHDRGLQPGQLRRVYVRTAAGARPYRSDGNGRHRDARRHKGRIPAGR